jgi:hypothetical protein
MSKGTRYGSTVNGHDVELVFDASKIVINRVTLVVDGTAVSSENIFYGERDCVRLWRTAPRSRWRFTRAWSAS